MLDQAKLLHDVVVIVNELYCLKFTERQIKIHRMAFRAQGLKHISDLNADVLATLAFMDLEEQFITALERYLKQDIPDYSPCSPPPPPPLSPPFVSLPTPSIPERPQRLPLSSSNLPPLPSIPTRSPVGAASPLPGPPTVETLPPSPYFAPSGSQYVIKKDYQPVHRFSQGLHVSNNPLHSQASASLASSFLSHAEKNVGSKKSTKPASSGSSPEIGASPNSVLPSDLILVPTRSRASVSEHMCCVCGERTPPAVSGAIEKNIFEV